MPLLFVLIGLAYGYGELGHRVTTLERIAQVHAEIVNDYRGIRPGVLRTEEEIRQVKEELRAMRAQLQLLLNRRGPPT